LRLLQELLAGLRQEFRRGGWWAWAGIGGRIGREYASDPPLSPSVLPRSATARSRSSSSSALPVPRTTHKSGSSASRAGGAVSWLISGTRPQRNAPPSARTMPLSDRSALGSGGAHSSAIRTASMRTASVSCWSVAMLLWLSARRRLSTCARRYRRRRSGTHRNLARPCRSRVPGRERA
jgi:hypothetical protein